MLLIHNNILINAYTIWWFCQISISCTIPSGSFFSHPAFYSYWVSMSLCLTCDEPFYLYVHVTYTCYSLLYWLEYICSLWHCFVLLVVEIQFISRDFSFVAMCRSFRKQSHPFCLKYSCIFLQIFVVLLVLMFIILLLAALMSTCLLYEMYIRVNVSELSSSLFA